MATELLDDGKRVEILTSLGISEQPLSIAGKIATSIKSIGILGLSTEQPTYGVPELQALNASQLEAVKSETHPDHAAYVTAEQINKSTPDSPVQQVEIKAAIDNILSRVDQAGNPPEGFVGNTGITGSFSRLLKQYDNEAEEAVLLPIRKVTYDFIQFYKQENQQDQIDATKLWTTCAAYHSLLTSMLTGLSQRHGEFSEDGLQFTLKMITENDRSAEYVSTLIGDTLKYGGSESPSKSNRVMKTVGQALLTLQKQ